MGLGASTGEAVQFGQMHLSEGSPATTVITATLDVSPGDAVEPCVSSLPDIQVGPCYTLKLPRIRTSLNLHSFSSCIWQTATSDLEIQRPVPYIV